MPPGLPFSGVPSLCVDRLLERIHKKCTRFLGSNARPNKDLGSGFDSIKTGRTLETRPHGDAVSARLVGIGVELTGLQHAVER